MGDEYQQDPNNPKGPPEETEYPAPKSPPPYQQDIDFEQLKNTVVQGLSEAQLRIKRTVDRASTYWQQTQVTPTPRQATSNEEQHIRQLADLWSNENWRVARELGTYMEIISMMSDEIWEATLQTRWETRRLEITSEPYVGKATSKRQPLLPIWDYELPAITGLKAPETRTRLEGMDEIVSCTACNSTGHVSCSICSGRGWVVCPDCKGRTKKRCTTCRGRGYISDWSVKQRKPFFKRQADNVANSVTGKVSDVFESIRNQGVPIPNPTDTDPAKAGPTIPCPDCINGEAECTCGNGKRVCSNCQGARSSLCTACNGTGKLIRHREITRAFDLNTQTRFIGECDIPQQQLSKASGDMVYNAELNEPIYHDAAPENIPTDVWNAAVALVETETRRHEKVAPDPQSYPRATLQVLELVRIPYSRIQYRYGEDEYELFIYDGEGKEKFHATRFPARWDRIERLVKAITTDLMTPAQPEPPAPYRHPGGGYRVPVEVPPYNISEENEDQPEESDPNDPNYRPKNP